MYLNSHSQETVYVTHYKTKPYFHWGPHPSQFYVTILWLKKRIFSIQLCEKCKYLFIGQSCNKHSTIEVFMSFQLSQMWNEPKLHTSSQKALYLAPPPSPQPLIHHNKRLQVQNCGSKLSFSKDFSRIFSTIYVKGNVQQPFVLTSITAFLRFQYQEGFMVSGMRQLRLLWEPHQSVLLEDFKS